MNNFDFNYYNTNIIRDSNGNRLVKCDYCGKVSTDNDFISYGGKNHINFGTCYDCNYNNPKVINDLRKKNETIDEQFKHYWYKKYGIHFSITEKE